MKRLSLYLITILLLTSLDLYSQNSNKKYNFNYTIKEDQGELTDKRYLARVVLQMDVKADERPIRLQIFFPKPRVSTGNWLFPVQKL